VSSRAPKLVATALVVSCLVTVPFMGASADSGASSAPVATNLLTGETLALASSVGAWEAQAGTLSLAGRGNLAAKTTIQGWTLALSGLTTTGSAGQVYRGAFSVRAARTSRPVTPLLFFYDSAGAVLDRVKGEVGADSPSAWRPVTPVVAIAPPRTAFVALGFLTTGDAVNEVHYLTRPSVTTATPARTDVVGPLRTVGNKVVDANGPLVLRGIHRVALEGFMGNSTGKNLTAEDLGQAKRWGANTVRLSLSSSFWLSSNCHYDPRYAAAVDQAVGAVTSQRMVALLDLHTNTPTACGKVEPQVMADRSALTFWRDVATRYASNPLVAFDLYNEPHDISDKVWLTGGVVATRTGPFNAVGMQDLYDAVRGTGATNLVVVSGNNWANTLPANRVSGTDVVYGVHAYTCPTAVDGSCAPNPYDPSSILSSWVAPAKDVPVAVTEFGWPSTASGRYVQNVIAFAHAQGWGWIAFAWDGTTSGTFSLLSTSGPGASYQPTPAGMPVLDSLAAP
jgi:endoglucanase